MNNHGKFWLTTFNMLTIIYLFVILFTIVTNSGQDLTINKVFALPAFVLIIVNAAQFIVNYVSLTEN